MFGQYLAMVAIMGFAIYYLEKKGIPKIINIFIWTFYAVCPLIVGFLGVVLKDIIYSALCVLFIIFCVMYLDNNCQLNSKNLWGLVISATLCILTRNNGKEVICPTLFIIFFITILKNKKNIKQLICGCTVFVLPITLSLFIFISIATYYNIVSGSIAEALSFPFQQTARTVLQHGDELPLNEQKVIDQLLGYDTLADRYDPMLSDPVKGGYNGSATYSDLLSYIKVWVAQFLRYPLTYVEATLNQNFSLFNLYAEGQPNYYHNSDVVYESKILISESPLLEKVDKVFVLLYRLMHNMPIISLLLNANFWCIMLLVISVFIWHNKEYIFFIALLPLWLTIVCVILGPVVSPRYMYPIVYSMPFLLGYYVSDRCVVKE